MNPAAIGAPMSIEEGDALREEVASLREQVERLSVALAKLAIAARRVDVLGVDIAVGIGEGAFAPG